MLFDHKAAGGAGGGHLRAGGALVLVLVVVVLVLVVVVVGVRGVLVAGIAAILFAVDGLADSWLIWHWVSLLGWWGNRFSIFSGG